MHSHFFILFVELFKQVKTCIATFYKLKETKTFSLLRSNYKAA